MKMVSMRAAASLCALALAGAAGAAPKMMAGKSAVSAQDRLFGKQAAIGNMTEISTSKLALAQASSPALKQFARKMIQDHSKAAATFKPIAASKGLMLPKRLDAKHQALYNKLKPLHGAAFDRAYTSVQVAAHVEASNAFHTEDAKGADPAIKGFAMKTTPTIDGHLGMINDMSKGGSKMKM